MLMCKRQSIPLHHTPGDTPASLGAAVATRNTEAILNSHTPLLHSNIAMQKAKCTKSRGHRMLLSLWMHPTTSLAETFSPQYLYSQLTTRSHYGKTILQICPVEHFQLVMIFHHCASKTDKPASCMLEVWINGCAYLLNCSKKPRQVIKHDQHTSYSW